MKIITHPLLTGLLGSLLAGSAHAAVLAGWTFETNPPSLATGSTGPTIAADAGSGSFQGVHASSTSNWNAAIGNGSPNSFTSVEWTTGDYYQFSTSSTGYQGITVSFDQIANPGGPRDFQLSYSTDGTNYTDFGSIYAILRNAPTVVLWNSSTPSALTSYTFDLSGIAALDDSPSIYFRVSQVGTTPVNGTSILPTGSVRMDNVTISATPVPEPTTALLGALGLIGLLRRRR